MGKFFSALVTDKNEVLFFNKEQRDLIKEKKLKDKFGNFIFDADSHSSIGTYYFKNPYQEDACNKIEYNPFTNKIDCKSLVFPLDNDLIIKKLTKDFNVTKLNPDVNFSIRPFCFKNFSKTEVDNFINKNIKLIKRALRKFKQVENNVAGFFSLTRNKKVWDDNMFLLVHDNILVPTREILEREFMVDDIKINKAYAYSLRTYMIIAILPQCFSKSIIDNNENEFDTSDFVFLAKNGYVIACDGTNYNLYTCINGKVKPIYTL